MTLKDFYPFTRKISYWCLKQSDLTRFTLGIDSITNCLVVNLEWQFDQRICRTDHMFSYFAVYQIRDQKYLIDILESKAKQVRAEIHGV